ncbi:MAG: MFS transporter [Lachnospiraceae bacterium]|nr:MFS transporter [Lachnospiraceae bacterium]
MKKKLGAKFWTAMLIFGLVGQIAWVVENMYLNVFMYKMFHATASDISVMVSASAIAAALTTILIGALSDRVGKRKIFMCLGYIIWGITILGFALIKTENLSSFTLGVTQTFTVCISLVIVLDCIMTFFGSMANDACYNAWITDCGDESNRGKIEGFNSMMPLISILVVFGGFMGFNLDKPSSWTTIFCIIGALVLLIGILGFFLIEEKTVKASGKENTYWKNILYSFRPTVMKQNKLLYLVLIGFAVFGISIQVFMPYLIIYYEKSLGMENYVLIMAPAILIAAVITALYGKLYDMQGFKFCIVPSLVMLGLGYVILFFARNTIPVFGGSLLMMTGYLTGMSVFGAMIRDNIPENKAGQFQGIRIIGQVLIPGVIGPYVGAWVLKNAEMILNNDGTYSFLPNKNIWVAALIVIILLAVYLYFVFRMMRKGHYDLNSEHNDIGWDMYPRPQMKRDNYMILDSSWKLNGQDILVPFPPQANLSGYHGKIDKTLVYEKKFTLPKGLLKERFLLHFGAVDQIAEVWLNNKYLGKHEGGYLPFTFDVTGALNNSGENYLKVVAYDDLSSNYPYGKQTKKRGGMWYTPVSGIWQNVWMENVPGHYIKNVKLTPDKEGIKISLNVDTDDFKVALILHNGEVVRREFEGKEGYIKLSGLITEDGTDYQPQLWTPENPYLYNMTVFSAEDKVDTYFALRTIEIKETDGIQRVLLNNKPVFLHGVLDQGYFCDGLFLPANEEEYERDILRMKELGYNMLRKHIKIEPEYFYYACDKLGMLVVQDMVNSGKYSFIGDTALPTIGMKKRKDSKGGIKGKRKEFFVAHTKETLEHLYNHPCIVAYTIFNEGWGQFESDKMYDLVKKWDDTRLIDSTSGWFHQEKSDFDSQHIYFKVVKLPNKERPLFVSECGGYTMAVKDHYYSKYATYGYGACQTREELTKEIVHMYDEMIISAIADGACGCVYTQLSDVEDEINGLYTYDRKVCKVDAAAMKDVADRINEEVGRI